MMKPHRAAVHRQALLKGGLLAACMLVYIVGVSLLIDAAIDSPLKPLLEVGRPLAVYCCLVVVCLAAMVIFVRHVPVATEATRADDGERK